jgi:hypothetical protein
LKYKLCKKLNLKKTWIFEHLKNENSSKKFLTIFLLSVFI